MTKSQEGKTFLTLANAEYVNMFELDLRKQKNSTKLVKSQIWSFADSSHKTTRLACQQDIFFVSNTFLNIMLTPNGYFHNNRDRFLEPFNFPIDVVYARKQFYPWMVFGGTSRNYTDRVPKYVQMIDNQDTLQ